MENKNVITLTFEDGSEKEFDILFTYQSEQTGKNYVFIIDGDSVGVLEYVENGDGTGQILPLDETDDDLWEEINEVFEAYQNELDTDGCAGCPGANSDECDGCTK